MFNYDKKIANRMKVILQCNLNVTIQCLFALNTHTHTYIYTYIYVYNEITTKHCILVN